MICDDCRYKDKCNRIISESATDCVDKNENRRNILPLPNDKSLVYYSSNTSFAKSTLTIAEVARTLVDCYNRGVRQDDMRQL